MNYRRIYLLLLPLILLVGCVESYQRYLEAIYIGGDSADVLTLLDKTLREEGFSLLGTRKGRDYTVVSNFTRYDSSISKDIRLDIYLRDGKVKGENTEILFTVGAQGWSDATKHSVDKEFESLVDKIEARLGAQLRVIRKSESG